MPREQSEDLHPTIRPFKGQEDFSTTPQDIEDWYRHMLDRHKSLAELLEWKVTQLQWYKNTERLEHEYVVFTVQASKQPIELFLRIDRRSTAEQLRKERTEALVSKNDNMVLWIPSCTTDFIDVTTASPEIFRTRKGYHVENRKRRGRHSFQAQFYVQCPEIFIKKG